MNYFFNFCTVIFLTMSLSACSLENDIITHECQDSSDIISKYNVYYKQTKDAISLEEIDYSYGKNPIENFGDGNTFSLEYLLSLSEEQMDSIIQHHSATYNRAEIESAFDSIIDTLIQNTSVEEVTSFFEFVKKYGECGGHSFDLIELSTNNFTPYMKDLSIKSAALFDKFTESVPTSLFENEEKIGKKGCTTLFLAQLSFTLTMAALTDGAALVYVIEGAALGLAYRACLKTGEWHY